ncbi:hypothetical protein ABTD28_20030, partial [Acinetobacter baumannii]
MLTDARVVEAEGVDALMREIGFKAKEAARRIGLAPADTKSAALRAAAAEIRARAETILAANAE